MKGLMTSIASVACLICSTGGQAQESLPFPPAPFAGVAARTMQESTYVPRQVERHLPEDAPNILIIMLDDAGPALPDTFGGDIHTPTLTRLRDSGVCYNRFHNAAVCSPTRAALLTGRNPHRSGFGQIAELANAWDGYTGSWPATTSSVAKVLGYYGYATAAFGKWHNTPANETTQLGPFDRWPTGRLVGFDYFYGFLTGESSQWEPAVVENTVRQPPPHGEGYHFTVDMADHAISWMRQQHALTPDRPFLMYWTPGAPHGPHHIFREWADKYKGKFDDGWDVMRERIFARQKELGWIPPETELTPRPETLASWDSIPEAEKPFQRRLMEIFAGFTEHADTEAGRLIDELERLGERDNTLIFYVWSDNGSSAEGQNGTISELLAQNGIATEIKDHIRALDELGGLDALGTPKTDNMYHAGWAWAGSTPFKATKTVVSHFGGTRTPLVVSWPKSIQPDATPHPQFHYVNDIAPTIYDVLDITPPRLVDGVTQDPMDGVSMEYSFASAAEPGRKASRVFRFHGEPRLLRGRLDGVGLRPAHSMGSRNIQGYLHLVARQRHLGALRSPFGFLPGEGPSQRAAAEARRPETGVRPGGAGEQGLSDRWRSLVRGVPSGRCTAQSRDRVPLHAGSDSGSGVHGPEAWRGEQRRDPRRRARPERCGCALCPRRLLGRPRPLGRERRAYL